MVLVHFGVQEVPDWECKLVDGPRLAVLLRVAQECAEQVRVRVLSQLYQVCLSELESARELLMHLVDAVKPLQEHRAALVDVVAACRLPAAVSKLVPERQPLALDQNLKALSTEQQTGAIIMFSPYYI